MCIAALKLLFQKQFVHFGRKGELGGVQGEKKKETETFNTEFHGDYYFSIMSASDRLEEVMQTQQKTDLLVLRFEFNI